MALVAGPEQSGPFLWVTVLPFPSGVEGTDCLLLSYINGAILRPRDIIPPLQRIFRINGLDMISLTEL